MISNAETNSPNILSIFVHEEVRVSEACGACQFILIDGIDYGYLLTEPENFEDSLNRGYDILFEETLKRLKAKGVHLRL